MICDCRICRRAVISFRPQVGSGPTRIVRIQEERGSSSFTTRKTGNGQSAQNFLKNWAKGRQASKNGSQLETTIAILSAKGSSGFMFPGERCGPIRSGPRGSKGAGRGSPGRLDVRRGAAQRRFHSEKASKRDGAARCQPGLAPALRRATTELKVRRSRVWAHGGFLAVNLPRQCPGALSFLPGHLPSRMSGTGHKVQPTRDREMENAPRGCGPCWRCRAWLEERRGGDGYSPNVKCAPADPPRVRSKI